jgi:Flp pilus assembly CpaF family ATPase
VAAIPTDSFKNSRRFIAISDEHARTGRVHAMAMMMVRRRNSVEGAGKITMPTLMRMRQALDFFREPESRQEVSFTTQT